MKFSKLIALIALATAFPALAADVTINQMNKVFSQPVLDIPVGDTVLWSNSDSVSHNIMVYAPDGAIADLGLQKRGQLIKHTFTAPGAYRVLCSIHSSMHMTVNVK